MSNAIKFSAPVQSLTSLEDMGYSDRVEDDAAQWPNGIDASAGWGMVELLDSSGATVSHHVARFSPDGSLSFGKIGGSSADRASQRAKDEGMSKRSVTNVKPVDVAGIRVSIDNRANVVTTKHGDSSSAINGDTHGAAKAEFIGYRIPTDASKPGINRVDVKLTLERHAVRSTPVATPTGAPLFVLKASYARPDHRPTVTTFTTLGKSGESASQRHARIAAEF